jgi:predicted ATPase
MALGGQRQIVFITGEQGIGKTALADEFVRRAAASVPGLRIARGQCLESYGPKEAYYPMLEALGQLLRGPSAPSVIHTLAAQAPTWLVQFPARVRHEHRDVLQAEILGATRERMLREINEALETISAEQPLLVLFEDLHWADIPTVDLISTLARGRAGAKLMLLATCRPVDLTISNHSLKGLMHDLVVHQLSHELALQPLGIAEVAEYLSPSLQADLPKGLVEILHRHSDGNPLFLVAALEDLIQRGLLSQENGHWRLTIPVEEIDFRVPENLREMIEARIARLSVEEQRALEAASVSGTAFCVSVVASVTNVDFESFEELCEQLARRHHIVRSAAPLQLPDGRVVPRYEFVHGLYRELLYHGQAWGRRAKLHQRIGERLEVLSANWPGEVALELAHHFEASSDWSRAVKYLRLAADTAIRRLAQAEALGILHRALDLASKLPQAERTLAEKKILSKLAMTYADIESDDEHQQRHADLAESLQLVEVTGELRASRTESAIPTTRTQRVFATPITPAMSSTSALTREHQLI